MNKLIMLGLAIMGLVLAIVEKNFTSIGWAMFSGWWFNNFSRSILE